MTGVKIMTETKAVKIIADSTCDLSKELLTRYDISVLPLHILLGEQECEDGINVTPDEIYQWSDANKTTPKTSAPSMERAMELIRPYTDAGREVICFSISGEMSTSGNVMRLAAEELGQEGLVTFNRNRSSCDRSGYFGKEGKVRGRDRVKDRAAQTQSAGKFCGRHIDLFISRRTMQRSGSDGRRRIKAASEDRRGRRSDAPDEKIPWKDGQGASLLRKRNGNRLETRTTRQSLHYPFRMRRGDDRRSTRIFGKFIRV